MFSRALVLCLVLAGCGGKGDASSGEKAAADKSHGFAPPDSALKPSRPVPRPQASANRVAEIVGRILSEDHYRGQKLDDLISKEFLKLYLDDLDYPHMIFLQSDVEEFQKKWMHRLDDEIQAGNVDPGFEIYERYVRRLEDRMADVQKLIKEDFKFDGDDTFVMDRHELPWPKDEKDARDLWRKRIKFDLLQERLNGKKPEEAMVVVQRRLGQALRMTYEEDSESLLLRYLTALCHAYDPHSDYLSPTELDSFEVNMKLSLEGIGAMLRSEDGYPKVIAIVPGGPADLDNRLQVNDRIVAVAQGNEPMVEVVDLKLSKAVSMIRGKKGTTVRLLVWPGNATDPSTRNEIHLVRDEIKNRDAEAKGKIYEREDSRKQKQKVGYIDIPSFYADMQSGTNGKSVTRDTERLLQKLKDSNVRGAILDLRKNGGGSLTEAIRLTGLFIPDGPVLQVKNSRGRVEVLSDEDPRVVFDKPIVVMVSHISASASEILAAALQDYHRAVVVGDQSSFGKGTVQKVEDLDRHISLFGVKGRGGALKFTTQKFYRVSGGSTQHRGVIPDILFPNVRDLLKIREASYPHALPYDEVAPAIFEKMTPTTWNLSQLQKKSRERVEKDVEFSFVREDIERFRVQVEEKAVSLNEKKRLDEKKANIKRAEKRNEDRKKRVNPLASFEEITLATIDPKESGAPSVTRKVLEQADANSREGEEDFPKGDPLLDPELDESIHILLDLIEQSGSGSKPDQI